MRIAALGGSGGMGRHAVRTALLDPTVEELVVADLDERAAQRTAAEAGPRASAVRIDVSDARALHALLEDCDVVMNCVGPFFRFGVPILRAAIQARCHYLDICDDWEPTLEMLELDDVARDAGLTGIVGLGASPGVSNLLAVMALEELDHADEVFTVWSLEGAGEEPGAPATGRRPSAASVHGVHQLTGRIRALEGGELRDVRPRRRIDLDYPGLGRHSVYTIGHPESVTLHRTFPTLRRSNNAMFGSRSTIWTLRILAALVDLRLASVERVAGWLERLAASESANAPTIGEELSELDGLPPLFALARGRKDGRPASAAVALTTAPPGGMGPITGIPLALGTSLLATGVLKRRGVCAPEAAIDPQALLDRLAEHCEPRPSDPADMTVTTCSWSDTRLADAFGAAWSRFG